jgi:hypothetical protein
MTNHPLGIKRALWRSLHNADAKGTMWQMETAGQKAAAP